jgi:hypothetical protein
LRVSSAIAVPIGLLAKVEWVELGGKIPGWIKSSHQIPESD